MKTKSLYQIYFYLFTASLFLTFASCGKEQIATIDPEKFTVIHPVIQDTVITTDYVAEIQSLQNIELHSKIEGFLEKNHVDEGAKVKAGQLLFTISNRKINEEVAKAKAELKSAIAESKVSEVELANTKLLAEQDIVSKSELEMARAKYDASKAEIEQKRAELNSATIQLSLMQIKAPFDGVINRIPFKAGSAIEEGALLTTLSNNKEVYVYFNFSESDYMSYIKNSDTKDNAVSLITADGQLYPFKGNIETAESEIHKSSGGIAVRAKFPNPKSWLSHGATGKVVLSANFKDALLIPQKSTFGVQENIYVFVVDENNIVQTRKINPSAKLNSMYVIASGLSSTDKVIYEGIQLVKNGDKIIPEIKGMQSLLAQKL